MNLPEPSKQLLYRAMAGFVRQGTSLSAWCRRHKIDKSAARHALIGSWDGPKSRQLRERLLRAADIEKVAA